MRETLEIGRLQGHPPDAIEHMAMERTCPRGEIGEPLDAPRPFIVILARPSRRGFDEADVRRDLAAHRGDLN